MKKTRRAAAVWITMSLALSTIFGNTAWGEVLQETGGNRCTHVHTAECYGDLDETATPSQIGELEPAKCTHVCSEETGCIQNIKNEGGLSTPSNADDSTVKPGTSTADDSTVKPGTTTRVDTQTKTKNEIHSWTWYDPEEILIGGKLELTGVTEEAQPSFEEVTEYLPQAIIAQVGDSDVWEEKNLQIANWTCAEYVQDEKGLWPLEGNYEFTAELPDGYELADGVDTLVVEVSVAGDEASVTATPSTYLVITQGGQSKYVTWDGTNLANASGNGWVATNVDNQGNFKLKLTNAALNQIYISGGNWTIELEGNNSLDGNASPKRGLFLYGLSSVTIVGDENATLEVSVPGTRDSSAIDISSNSSLTINRGIVKATIDYAGSDAGGSAAINVSGTLNISGGKVIARGIAKSALRIAANPGGNFNMSGGTLEASGTRKIIIDNAGKFELAGGSITAISDTNGYGFVANGTSTIISGEGELNTNILFVDRNRTMSIGANATVTTNGVIIKSNGTLENNGHLVIDISLEGDGTFTNNGIVSGNGTLPDNLKMEPGEIKVSDVYPTTKYTGNPIKITNVTTITKPDNAGSLQYTLVKDAGSENKDTGKINSETGELTVKKIGTFRIEVKTKKEGLYQEGKPVYITLTVTPGDYPEDWTLTVDAVNKVYDGKEETPAIITVSNIPEDVNASYQYQLADSRDVALSEANWDSSLKVKDVADLGKYVFVRVVTDNYKPIVFCSNNQINIEKRNFTDVNVTVNPQTVTYDGESKNPEINVFENWLGSSGNKVDNEDYKIEYWTDEKGVRVTELKNAGTYTAHLRGYRNYKSEEIEVSFTVEKCKLEPDITGTSVIKTYDGTSEVKEDQGLIITLEAIEGKKNPADDVYVNSVDWSYRGTDAGVCYIDAKNITLAGKDVGNYKLTKDYDEIRGEIVRRKFDSINVSSTPLIYNGTVQKAQIDASVNTGLDKVSGSNAKFFYSIDDEKFDSEVPSFKDAGTYTVHVKATMDNFNDIKKDVEVVVQKAAAPTAAGLSETYSYKETGEKRVKFTGIPEDCGTLGAVTAQIASDEGQILEGSPAVDGSEVVFKLKGSSRKMIGKTAQIVVTVETKNYENIEIPVTVTLKADPSDNNSENGNSSSDDSDYNDSKTTAPKLSDVRSGNAANSVANNVTKDSKKGYWSNARGIITGADNQVTNDGYSHWMKDSKGWWLRYSDGSYPKGSAGEYHWEKINGRWWAFGADGYLSTGWIYDTFYQGWFYMDANQGMLTGWQFIDGKWYYLNPVSDGTSGIMYAKKRTPDGWLVKEDGSWDEEAGR